MKRLKVVLISVLASICTLCMFVACTPQASGGEDNNQSYIKGRQEGIVENYASNYTVQNMRSKKMLNRAI